MTISKNENTKLINRGVFLEYLTLGLNIVGVVILLIAAFSARSVALAGFGFDSLIEIFASIVVIWQLKSINKTKEKFAERLIGYAFFALALYIAAQIIVVLLSGTHPQQSVLGITWLILTVSAMLLLALAKKRTGDAIPNVVLQKESKVTLIDAALAISVLTGLIVNALFGIWYADILAATVIIYYGVKEGLQTVKA